MSLISVVLPVYNGEKTIKATIGSVLQQSVSDLELIVVNDGSQDSTLEIASRIEDSRVKVFSYYPNSGVAISRNRGIENASGDYISFIDADDLWTPDKLAYQLKALESNPQAAVAYSWTDCIDENDRFLRPGGHITANGDVYEQLLIRDFVESGSNPLICKQALAEVGGFDQSLTPAEDWDMWLRLAARYHFVAVPYPHILYRISTTSASANVVKMELASLVVIERALDRAPKALQHLRKDILTSRYNYLTFKCLEDVTSKQKNLLAIRYLWCSLKGNPLMLLRVQVMLIVLFKIAIGVLLPAGIAQTILLKLSRKHSSKGGKFAK